MKIHEKLEQGGYDWLVARIGKVTASEIDNLLTPNFEPRKGETPHTYMCSKLAEALRGNPLPGFGSWSTEQGSIREEQALPWVELQYNIDIQRVGFIESDDGRCGCSPDGLIGEDGGVEIKCPEAHTHVKYLLADTVPKDYLGQVHFSMFVTGRPWWRFVSFRHDMDALVVDVQRDEEICAKIQETLEAYYKRYDAALSKLKALQ